MLHDIEGNPIGAMTRNTRKNCLDTPARDETAESGSTIAPARVREPHDDLAARVNAIDRSIHAIYTAGARRDGVLDRHDAELAALRSMIEDQVQPLYIPYAMDLDAPLQDLVDADGRDDAAQDEAFPDNEPLESQVDYLATVLIDEFGGPTRSEGAIAMAIRVLREQKVALTADADGEVTT